MTKKDLLRFYAGINSISNLEDMEIAYSVNVNYGIIKKDIEALLIAEEPRQDFLDYELSRDSICRKHCEKNKSGEPVIIDGNYKIKSKTAFESEIKKLDKKNKKAIDYRGRQIKWFEKILNEEVSFNFRKVRLSDLPKDMRASSISAIIEMVH